MGLVMELPIFHDSTPCTMYLTTTGPIGRCSGEGGGGLRLVNKSFGTARPSCEQVRDLWAGPVSAVAW